MDAWQVVDEESARFIANEVGGMFAKEVRQQQNGPHHPPSQGFVPCVQINTLQGPKRAYQTDYVVRDDAAVTIYREVEFEALFVDATEVAHALAMQAGELSEVMDQGPSKAPDGDTPTGAESGSGVDAVHADGGVTEQAKVS